MQRRAHPFLVGAALAVVLAGGLTGCTSSPEPDGSGGDTEPGDSTATAAPAEPGKYRTLPEACGAVSRELLRKLLPGATDTAGSGDDPDASPYEGEPKATYDTDRRVGCSWQTATTLGSRRLTVDFERPVSYDPAMSDDEQTEELYVERAEEAGVSPSAPPTEVESPDTASGGGGDGSGAGDSEDAEDSGGSGSGDAGGGDETGLPDSPPRNRHCRPVRSAASATPPSSTTRSSPPRATAPPSGT